MPLIILIALGLWFAFGEPFKTVANWFWASDAAPWESVDAFYYPDRNNLSVFNLISGFGSVDGCRTWIYTTAAANGDPGLVRGDYECGVQKLDTFMGLSVYRTTVK